jgi:hypothetical protein
VAVEVLLQKRAAQVAARNVEALRNLWIPRGEVALVRGRARGQLDDAAGRRDVRQREGADLRRDELAVDLLWALGSPSVSGSKKESGR